MRAIHWNRRVALSIALAMMGLPALAQTPPQTIHKCVDGGGTAYQSTPCGNAQTEVRVMTLARADAQPQSAVSSPSPAVVVPKAQSPGKMWPPRRSLMLGMSDDEVLNLAGWGVPGHITRTRAARGWREEWIYPAASGERRLYFVNATLVDAVLDPHAAQQIASERRVSYPAT
jgi:hypothetical protein